MADITPGASFSVRIRNQRVSNDGRTQYLDVETTDGEMHTFVVENATISTANYEPRNPITLRVEEYQQQSEENRVVQQTTSTAVTDKEKDALQARNDDLGIEEDDEADSDSGKRGSANKEGQSQEDGKRDDEDKKKSSKGK